MHVFLNPVTYVVCHTVQLVTCLSEIMAITHVVVVHSSNSVTIYQLLNTTSHDRMHEDFASEQEKNPELKQLLCFLRQGSYHTDLTQHIKWQLNHYYFILAN